jgi:3-oxoacyl-[acyl-carrier protein] reductase
MSSRGTAVVTGAGQGIGRAIAERLVADGYGVLAVDVDAGTLADVSAALGCRTAVVDVTDDAAVAAVAGQAPECRVLVNNAAIQRYQDLLHTTHDEMRTVLDVNVIGPVLMAQALVPLMAANGGGVVINLSSITSRAHAAATSLYPASKAAVNQLTEAMAVEFAPLGVRCNAVGPGTVITEGTAGHYGDEGMRAAIAGVLPVNRMGQPEDIANAVSFLCSDEASWITGQTLFVDGGYTAAHGSFFRSARKAPR